MIDDRQTAVLDLEDLPPEKARRLDRRERRAAMITIACYVFDNAVRCCDRLQGYAGMTGLPADS